MRDRTGWGRMRSIVALWAAALVAACGGGGSDGGGSGGGATPTAVETFAVGGVVTGLTASGLVLQLNGAGDLAVDAAASFSFGTPLPVGTAFTVTVRTNPAGQICSVATGGAGVASPSSFANVAVTCTVPINATPASFSVGGAVTGLTTAGLVLRNGVDDLSVPPNATQFTFPSTVADGTAYAVTIVAQPPTLTCALSNATGTIAGAAGTTVTVTCGPAPTQSGFTVDKASLSFDAEQGAALPEQTIVGTVVGATAPVFVTIVHTNVGIEFARFTQTSPEGGQLVVTPRVSRRTPGTFDDTITASVCYDSACTRPVPGSPKVIPVKTTIRPPTPPTVLLLSHHGIALTVVPGRSSLTRQVTVSDSSGSATTWTAASDQPWLTVTAAGSSGGALTLTAVPFGLGDGIHEARVTVTSSNAALAAQTIRVGLYVSGVASADTFANPPDLLGRQSGLPLINWCVDPIRPLTYTGSGSTIAIDHVYTGARVATIDVPGATYGAMGIGDDGSRLYALNDATRQLDVFDLDARQLLASYSLSPIDLVNQSTRDVRLVTARVLGKPVLILGEAYLTPMRGSVPILDAKTGVPIGVLGTFGFRFDTFVVSRDSRVVYVSTAGLSGVFGVTRIELKMNGAGNVYGLFVGETPSIKDGPMQDLATNADGSRVYGAWLGRSVSVIAYSNGALTEVTPLPPNAGGAGNGGANIEFDSLGRMVTSVDAGNLRRYAADETLLREWTGLGTSTSVTTGPIGLIDSRRVSSDGLRYLGNGRMFDLE